MIWPEKDHLHFLRALQGQRRKETTGLDCLSSFSESSSNCHFLVIAFLY